MTFTPGQTGHTAEHNSIRADLDGRLSDETLAETFIAAVDTSGAAIPGFRSKIIWDTTSTPPVPVNFVLEAI